MKKVIVALTGSIATGKTNLTKALIREGAQVLDADEISRSLTGPGGAALPALREAFGADYFLPDGTPDRRKLGAAVFSDPAMKKKLEAILHPAIIEEMIRSTQALEGVVFWAVPLLYECGMDGDCDRVWCTYVPKKEQVRRVMHRDHLTRKEALMRVESQIPAREKARRADRVFRTDGPKEATAAAAVRAYHELLEEIA